jgi:hypothetical protein
VRLTLRTHGPWTSFLAMALSSGTALAAALSGSATGQDRDLTAASPFDGTYHGMSKLVETSISSCDAGTLIDFQVRQSRFHGRRIWNKVV